jgi:hypothetical protein
MINFMRCHTSPLNNKQFNRMKTYSDIFFKLKRGSLSRGNSTAYSPPTSLVHGWQQLPWALLNRRFYLYEGSVTSFQDRSARWNPTCGLSVEHLSKTSSRFVYLRRRASTPISPELSLSTRGPFNCRPGEPFGFTETNPRGCSTSGVRIMLEPNNMYYVFCRRNLNRLFNSCDPNYQGCGRTLAINFNDKIRELPS